jgi:hypothetical protein
LTFATLCRNRLDANVKSKAPLATMVQVVLRF